MCATFFSDDETWQVSFNVGWQKSKSKEINKTESLKRKGNLTKSMYLQSEHCHLLPVASYFASPVGRI